MAYGDCLLGISHLQNRGIAGEIRQYCYWKKMGQVSGTICCRQFTEFTVVRYQKLPAGCQKWGLTPKPLYWFFATRCHKTSTALKILIIHHPRSKVHRIGCCCTSRPSSLGGCTRPPKIWKSRMVEVRILLLIPMIAGQMSTVVDWFAWPEHLLDISPLPLTSLCLLVTFISEWLLAKLCSFVLLIFP